jgi:diguanylate cyclase (GGDEF)-like protein
MALSRPKPKMQPPTPHVPIAARHSAAARQHAFRLLRLRRFGMALLTYVLGFALLSVCALLGLLPTGALLRVGGLFLLINIALGVAFASGWNERWADPSLTLLQMGLAVSSVAVILVVGRSTQFVAAPFYSVLFVFGMLQLRPRQIAGMTLYLLLSYALALALRLELFQDVLDLRIEAVTAALVVGSSVWFAVAAGYISNLRARLRESRQQIQALATRDGLTGLWNRRCIDVTLDAAVQHAARHGTPLCVVLVDVDHFKHVNDRHGHAIGDQVLKAVASCLATSVRAEDHVGRFGGEEFLLILPATSLSQATVLTERLRERLNAQPTVLVGEGPVTASFGLADWRNGEVAGALVHRADQALYRAKVAGRNRVETSSSQLAACE